HNRTASPPLATHLRSSFSNPVPATTSLHVSSPIISFTRRLLLSSFTLMGLNPSLWATPVVIILFLSRRKMTLCNRYVFRRPIMCGIWIEL
ncbi:unnamed protein product, partial [Linum tenue]